MKIPAFLNWVIPGSGLLRNMHPSLRRALNYLLAAFFFSIVFLCLLYVFCWIFDVPENNWAFSLLDSVTGNVLSFGLIGIVAAIVSLKPPETDEIERRIGYLYSARRDESPAAHRFLIDAVKLLGATAAQVHMRYTVSKIENGKVTATVKSTTILANMMKHDHYSQEIPIKWNCEEGCIKLITAEHGLGDNAFELPYLERETPHEFSPENQTYEDKTPIEIKPGGRMRYIVEAELTEKLPQTNACAPNRFAERLKISYKNNSPQDVVIGPTGDPCPGKVRTIEREVTLKHGESVEFDFVGVMPSERILSELRAASRSGEPPEGNVAKVGATVVKCADGVAL